MRRSVILILFLVTVLLLLHSDIANARHQRYWKHKHYYTPHKPTHTIYVHTLDLNNDRIIDRRDRLLWIQKNYVPNSAKKIAIVSEEEDVLSELDLNKDGIIDSAEMAYWITKYDINKNGVLEEYEIGMALA